MLLAQCTKVIVGEHPSGDAGSRLGLILAKSEKQTEKVAQGLGVLEEVDPFHHLRRHTSQGLWRLYACLDDSRRDRR